MASLRCPIHVECQFPKVPIKTPSDILLGRIFCEARYDACAIAKTMLAGRPVPVGACPDGNVKE